MNAIGTRGDRQLYTLHCPMAFGNQGADWLQATETVANPYYGASMLRCGNVREQVAGGGNLTSPTDAVGEAQAAPAACGMGCCATGA